MTYAQNDSHQLEEDGVKLVDYTVVFTKYDREEVLAYGRKTINEKITGGMFEREIIQELLVDDDNERISEENQELLQEAAQDDVWVYYSILKTRAREEPKSNERQAESQERIADYLERIVDKKALRVKKS